MRITDRWRYGRAIRRLAAAHGLDLTRAQVATLRRRQVSVKDFAERLEELEMAWREVWSPQRLTTKIWEQAYREAIER